MQPLSKSQVHRLLSKVSFEQQEFLTETSKQSKKSKWLEVLARNKGLNLQPDAKLEDLEALIEDWVLIEILDSGFGTRDYRCICGMPLRYQYVVLNKEKGEQLGLGVKCFENHTSLSPEVVKDIIKEFHKIDLERDEILRKTATNQYFNIQPFRHLQDIPTRIIKQADLRLPLTDKQIAFLEKLNRSFDKKQRLEKILRNLQPGAREVLESFPERIKGELVSKLVHGHNMINTLPDGFRDEEIEKFLTLKLPLLDSQMERIFQYNQRRNSEKKIQRQREEEEFYRRIRETRSVSSKVSTIESVIDYETLIRRHLSTLKKVREKEEQLSQGMKNDWLKIQVMIRKCKNGDEFDYSSFKVNLAMICLSLRIESDVYL